MKKALAILLVVALAFAAIGCGKPEESQTHVDFVVEDTQTPAPVEPDTTTPDNTVAMPDGSPMVAVGEWHVVGLASDGKVLAAGNNGQGQCQVADWSDVVYIAAGGNDTAALKSDGTVVFAGENQDAWSAASAWTGVARIHVEEGNLCALLSDGTVTSTAGASTHQAADFDDKTSTVAQVADGTWANAVQAAAGEFVSAAVMADGTVATAGRYEDAQYLVANWNLSAGVGAERPAAADPNEKKMADAKDTNSDVIGYVHINNTELDFPVLWDDWSDGDWYYNNHDIEKKKTGSPGAGSIYALTSDEPLIINTITGHNMRVSATMFHDLHHVQEINVGCDRCQGEDCGVALSDTLPNLTHYGDRVWNITAYGHSRWEVFAMYEVKENEPDETLYYNTNFTEATNKDNIDQWIQYQLERSEISLGITPTADDDFLCVYTCGTEYDHSTAQSRLYYFLRAVD